VAPAFAFVLSLFSAATTGDRTALPFGAASDGEDPVVSEADEPFASLFSTSALHLTAVVAVAVAECAAVAALTAASAAWCSAAAVASAFALAAAAAAAETATTSAMRAASAAMVSA
jgi:hypothetical protein